MGRLAFLLPCVVVLMLGGPLRARAEEPEVADLQRRVFSLLDGQHFGELEKMAAEFRNLDIRVRGGNPELYEFYRALIPGDASTCACQSDPQAAMQLRPVMEQQLQRLDAWLQDRPDSLAARLLLADNWIKYAWVARGTSYAAQVTPAQWELVRQRLDRAQSHLATIDPKSDAHAYEVLTKLAQFSFKPRIGIDALYNTAIERFPTYFPLYAQHAELMQQKWFGRPGEPAAYINSFQAAPGGEDGKIAYSYAAYRLMQEFATSDFFSQTGLTWPQIRAAYAARDKRYGLRDQDWNALARIAIWVPDKDAARDALAHIDGRWDQAVWRTKEYFDRAAAWIQAR
jgi:hypothetical protein